MWMRRRAPRRRKMAMSAVAALTARGVWDTWISSRERLAYVEEAKERGDKPRDVQAATSMLS
jgi:hypothetical protein